MCSLLQTYTILTAVKQGYDVYSTVLASGPGGLTGYAGAALTGIAVSEAAIANPQGNAVTSTMRGFCELLEKVENKIKAKPVLVVLRSWLDDPPDPDYRVTPSPTFADLSGFDLAPDTTGIADAGFAPKRWPPPRSTPTSVIKVRSWTDRRTGCPCKLRR